MNVRPVGELTPFEAGVPKIFAIELFCGEPVAIEHIRLEGKGWQIAALDVPAKASIVAGQTVPLEFNLLTADDSNPVELKFMVDGEEQVRELDLSREFITGEKMTGSLEPLGEPAPPTSSKVYPPSSIEPSLEGPGFRRDAPTRKELDEQDDGIARRRQITVRGRIWYRSDTDRLNYAHGATAQIWDEDFTYDDSLGGVVIGPDGKFEITVDWSPQTGDSNPDLYVRVVSANSRIGVRNYWLNYVYASSTSTWDDFTGTVLDVGDRIIGGSTRPAAHVVKGMTRTLDWFEQTGHVVVPAVQVFWPSFWDTPHFDPPNFAWEGNGQIHIPDDKEWDEQTHIHEWTHFWVYHRAERVPPNYCVHSYCDDQDWYEVWDDCGHCAWCPETQSVAFSEGFPEWAENVVGRYWNDNYVDYMGSLAQQEERRECQFGSGSDFMGDPLTTEGTFANLLVDIEDSDNEDDPSTPGYSDELTVSPRKILDIVDEEHPTTPWLFIQAFKDRYPELREQFWATCMNNGYPGLDNVNPVTGALTSSSHQVNESSTNNRVTVSFDQATDNFSGIGGFAYEITENAPVDPGFTHEGSTPWMEFRTTARTPGTWFITLRVHDRAGNWASSYERLGPIIIQAPDPGDLRPEAPGPGWAYSIVPRNSSSSTDASVPAEVGTLSRFGWYWNASVVNYGEEAIFDAWHHVRLDGLSFGGYSQPIGEDTHRWEINQGPITGTTGLHTLELYADAGEHYAEPDETDNRYARQWVWGPTYTAVSGVARRGSPPIATGGWESVPDRPRYYNCAGLGAVTLAGTAPNPWVVAAVKADSLEEDVDVRLHDQATNSTSGFGVNIGASMRPAGYLDAVLLNAANRPASLYDFGILNRSESILFDFELQIEYGEPLPLESVLADSLIANQGLRIFTFDVVEAVDHVIELEAERRPGCGTIYAAWFDESFTTGELLAYDAVVATDYSGASSLVFAPQPGNHAVVIWRDPIDDDFEKRDFELRVRRAPTDLVAHQPTGWDAPLVPRPAQDATFSYAPEPTLLDGDAYSTYLNFAALNVGPATSGDFTVELLVDRIAERFASYSGFGPGSWVSYTPQTPITVRGGRHVVAMVVDYADTQPESDETNNVYGTQYVWEPTAVGLFSTGMRAEPPFRTADWERVTTGEVLYPNCDALRTLIFNPGPTHGNWGGFAVMPGEFSDVDIQLHELSTGARDGFQDVLASSQWSTGQLDLVLMNFRNTATRQFDLGLTMGLTQKVEDYKWMLTNSTWVGVDPGLGIGPYTMGTNNMLLLFEFRFDTPGLYHATLDVQDPSLDLGFSLYGPDAVYVGKEDIYGPTSAAFGQPAGADETFDFVVHESKLGHFCVAVWKEGYHDLPESGDFALNFVRDASVDAPDLVLPVATALRSVAPNPFNPRTTVFFDVAKRGHVRIAVYDIAGSRVRTLVAREEMPGRREVTWDGRDERGREVASGVYIVRLDAGGVNDTRKVALIK